MRRLSIGNRIKWMKICAMVWHLSRRKINDFKFTADSERTGTELDGRLQKLDETKINRWLFQIDSGRPADGFADISQVGHKITLWGIGLNVVEDKCFEIGIDLI
jgi:hypothetical protein